MGDEKKVNFYDLFSIAYCNAANFAFHEKANILFKYLDNR
ncbi:hypothetical protein CAAU_2581 [Caloramator australicus RC3]|uniref:Uncharacterized protein n=1 Tax=Caloramator australicus RC3 TaxID=857293 RepID=I7J6N9_9CLOT|nr:hypothetical protein CAAU_2581 [Caloramator australicus RC3]